MKAPPWTYSKIDGFEKCPKRYHDTQVTKAFSDSTSKNYEGQEEHRAIAAFVKSNGATPLPLGTRQYETQIRKLMHARSGYHVVEQKLGITLGGRPTGFLSSDVWMRTVIDFAAIDDHEALLVDWKTGKPREDATQLHTMALAIFVHMPEIKLITGAFAWLAEGWETELNMTRAEMPKLVTDLYPRIKAFEDAHTQENFPAKPCFLCQKYCPVRSCAYHGK